MCSWGSWREDIFRLKSTWRLMVLGNTLIRLRLRRFNRIRSRSISKLTKKRRNSGSISSFRSILSWRGSRGIETSSWFIDRLILGFWSRGTKICWLISLKDNRLRQRIRSGSWGTCSLEEGLKAIWLSLLSSLWMHLHRWWPHQLSQRRWPISQSRESRSIQIRCHSHPRSGNL